MTESTESEGNGYYNNEDYDDGSVTDSIGYAGSRYLQDPSLTKEQLSQKKIIELFEFRFLRCHDFKEGKWVAKKVKIINRDTGEIVEETMRPKANEIGIPSLVGLLESAMSMNTLLSNMGHEESRKYIGDFLTGVLDTIYINYDNYEIVPKDVYPIFSYIENLSTPTSLRGREGFTARFISRIFGERTQQEKSRYGGINL